MSQQVAALNKRLMDVDKQLADARKPNAGDQATIARLGAELAQARQACVRPWPGSNSGLPADLPHSTPAPGRK